MCCCCGLRGSTICASIFTLVQSLIGIAFSVLIIVNYSTCFKWLQMDNTLYFYYFYRAECFTSKPTAIATSVNNLDRTLTWGKVYLALNACWLLSSFLMTVCSSVKNINKKATYYLYSPWMIVTLAIAVTDLAATVTHFGDISTIQSLLDQASTTTLWWKILMGPLAMGLLSSRFIVGWIINFGMLICVSVSVVRMWKDDEGKVLSTLPSGGQPGSRHLPGAPPSEDHDWDAGYLPRVVERPKPGRPDAHHNDNNNMPPPGRAHYMGANVHSIVSQQPKVIVPEPRYREIYPRREEEKPRKAPKGYIPDAAISPRNENEALGGGSKQRLGVSTGLRNQLPWSYFQNPAEPRHPVPKQPDVEDDDVDRPPVPVPDYTLHIGKRPKAGSKEVSRSGSDASSDDRPALRQPRQSRASREADVLY